MSDATIPDSEESTSRSKKPLRIGVVLAILLGIGGFYSVWAGLILAPDAQTNVDMEHNESATPLPDIAFVPIQPLIINIGPSGANRYLRFQAQLEVERNAEQEITSLLPRIVDVLNGYLRAVETSELEERSALVRMRAQMLRRVQVVTGEGRVRDLLIMEFVLS